MKKFKVTLGKTFALTQAKPKSHIIYLKHAKFGEYWICSYSDLTGKPCHPPGMEELYVSDLALYSSVSVNLPSNMVSSNTRGTGDFLEIHNINGSVAYISFK